jgi:tRNA G18 (ribose-2'-O)-methylase SpoU
MGASAVHLVNVGPFDPAPAKGAFRKVPAHFHDSFRDARASLGDLDLHWFAFSPEAETALPDIALPSRAAFVFGHEERGLDFAAADYPDITWLRIPLAGPMESLNVSIAASIAMYEYGRQHGQ